MVLKAISDDILEVPVKITLIFRLTIVAFFEVKLTVERQNSHPF